jgi:DNA-directed RNA polymerase subunit beta'
MVEKLRPEVWDILEEVIQDHPVMLNRAPTLHRLGIQAFQPVLVEGRAIKLHPLVCTPFNADFDGDQMAVHVPLTPEAIAEARFLMLSVNNLLKPQDGKPVTVPTQDMILGSYYLTVQLDGERGEGMYFKDEDEAIMAYLNGDVELHALVKVKRFKYDEEGNVVKSKTIDTTVGRLIFNRGIPQDLGFIDRTDPEHEFDLEISFPVVKKNLSKIVEKCINVHGLSESAEVLDYIKATGYKYSTKGAVTVSVSDVMVPSEKKEILAEADKQVEHIHRQYVRGLITNQERYNEVIKVWEKATKDVADVMEKNFDNMNPIYMMATSGARGNINQLRQVAGMRGLMGTTSGKAFEIPVKSCFREGLDSLEYFISAHGARKGLTDTALRTADSGYLTRRLVDVSQDIIIRDDDCGSHEGIYLEEVKDGSQVIESLAERLTGRYLIEDYKDPKTGEVICDTNTLINDKIADKIVATGVKRIQVRSILGCKCKHGACSKCYGMGLATRKRVNIGESVGIIAAQSIGEPGTQLTMRTFHTGGVSTSGGDITQGLPRVEELFEARNPKGAAIITAISGTVHIKEEKRRREIVVAGKDDAKTYVIPFGSTIKVHDGDEIEAGDPLTVGSINPNDLLEIKGAEGVYEYIIAEVQKVYRNQGIDINDKHIEVITRQMLKKVRIQEPGDSGYYTASLVELLDFEEMNNNLIAQGKKPATAKRVLLGITKSALATESFLSAASFQETTRVLTEAAIKGKVDNLIGLKENVIIGKLIPNGTGLRKYQQLDINTKFTPPTPEERKAEELKKAELEKSRK